MIESGNRGIDRQTEWLTRINSLYVDMKNQQLGHFIQIDMIEQKDRWNTTTDIEMWV